MSRRLHGERPRAVWNRPSFFIVGCGPAGGIAAREAARAGVATVVLERDAVVGAKRVCAPGLRPGFCEAFDVPRSIVHCDPPLISVSTAKRSYTFGVGTAHTTTREELDGTIGQLARQAGADIGRCNTLFRSLERDAARRRRGICRLYAAECASTFARVRCFSPRVRPRGSTPSTRALSSRDWNAGLITCLQYRIYPAVPAIPHTYQVLEMHYYRSVHSGRNMIAWMFPETRSSVDRPGHSSKDTRRGIAR